MERFRVAAIVAASMITMGLATMLHEGGHVLVGRLAGGTPTLWTTTEVLGRFDSLSPLGFVAFGGAGSLVNALLCALGFWALRRRSASAESLLTAWFLFAVNGFLVTTKMMGEAIAGFGDWMTILHSFSAVTALRIVVAIVGTVGVAFLVRRSGSALARLLPAGAPSERASEARRIVSIGAVAAGALMLGGSIASPVASTRAVLLSLGAGLGPFLPMFFGTRFAGRISSARTVPLRYAGWPWHAVAGIIAIVMWFIIGPGIELAATPA